MSESNEEYGGELPELVRSVRHTAEAALTEEEHEKLAKAEEYLRLLQEDYDEL